jgi:hypothetical protein
VLLSLVLCVFVVRYIQQDGQVSAGQVGEGIKRYFLPVFYASFGVILLCCLGTVLLLVPGIYVSFACSMFVIIMVQEELGFIDTMERCFYLVKGHWWATFGFLLLIGIIQALMSMIAGLPLLAVTILRAFHVPGADHALLTVVVTSLAGVAGIFLYVISFTGIIFQYFHLVEIKDGTGLLEQVALIGRPAVPDYLEEDAP